MAYVLYEKKDHVVFITLNRPDRMNALGRELMAELTEAEAQFAEDNDAWVAVYTGAGDRAFSVGRDMKEAADPGSGGGDLTKFFEKGFFTSEKPTIAAVNGFAMGGGCEKALSCDVRICSTNAVFAFPEVSVAGSAPEQPGPGHTFNGRYRRADVGALGIVVPVNTIDLGHPLHTVRQSAEFAQRLQHGVHRQIHRKT